MPLFAIIRYLITYLKAVHGRTCSSGPEVGRIFLASLGKNSIITFQHIVIQVFWEKTRLLHLLMALFSGFRKSIPEVDISERAFLLAVHSTEAGVIRKLRSNKAALIKYELIFCYGGSVMPISCLKCFQKHLVVYCLAVKWESLLLNRWAVPWLSPQLRKSTWLPGHKLSHFTAKQYTTRCLWKHLRREIGITVTEYLLIFDQRCLVWPFHQSSRVIDSCSETAKALSSALIGCFPSGLPWMKSLHRAMMFQT